VFRPYEEEDQEVAQQQAVSRNAHKNAANVKQRGCPPGGVSVPFSEKLHAMLTNAMLSSDKKKSFLGNLMDIVLSFICVTSLSKTSVSVKPI